LSRDRRRAGRERRDGHGKDQRPCSFHGPHSSGSVGPSHALRSRTCRHAARRRSRPGSRPL